MNKPKLNYPVIIIILLLSLVLSACSSAATVQAQVVSAGTDLGLQEPRTDEPFSAQTAPENEPAQPETPVEGSPASEDPVEEDEPIVRPDGWSEESHGNDVGPNYEVVFPQDQVNTINISISPDNWQAMLDDMESLYGEQGSGGGMGMHPGGAPPEGAMPGSQPPQFDGRPPDGQQPNGQPPQPGPGRPGAQMPNKPGIMGTDNNPMWAEATVEFEGQSWSNVGIRFKGNSSLMSSWRSGNMKLPFKLDFDEFEDEYPEIDNQRFYGFKELTFSSGFNDESLLREKVAADIFRETGIPSAQTAFYAVYIDYGEGPLYFGLYTMVEVVDDTLIETQFEEDSGNVYKPESAGATFAEGTFSKASFDKETNQDEDDYSDILALYDALHSDLRTSDPAAWRAQLEAVFDVDTFVTWIATNTLIQNWDTYGVMNHNYYLYNDPTSGQLTWIPWDNNEALRNRMQRGALSLSLEEVGEDWPLIRFIIDDPVYHQMYLDAVEQIINGAFDPDKMAETFQYYHKLIQPYVTGKNGEQSGYTFIKSPQAFNSSVAALITHVQQRYEAAQAYLSNQAVTRISGW